VTTAGAYRSDESGRTLSPEEFTDDYYPDPDPEMLTVLQGLADRGLIRLTQVWCSELGLTEGGHFHGSDARHHPVTVEVVLDPPVEQRLRRKQVPVTLNLPLRSQPRGEPNRGPNHDH
jgi:hypothetical protein